MMTTVPAAGQVLGARYTLRDPIASGGMGDVWRATDDVLDREVAVKVLRHGPQTDEPGFRERFRDEARHSAALHHPNIAAVYDYGEDGVGRDATHYLVMELVPGRPLSALLRAHGAMAAGDVRGLVGQAALALAAAHEAGVVHRDVKPANIIVTPSGQAKLTDFGISRAAWTSGHTVTGEVLGTPEYLSPEQALGEPATAASDVYALGVIAHELLTGRKPFDGGSPVATALAQVNDPPPPLPETAPPALRAVIEACLAKDPASRPPSARALADALASSDRSVHMPAPASLWTERSLDVNGVGTERSLDVDGAPATSATPATSAAPAAPATRAMPAVDPAPRPTQLGSPSRAQRHTSTAKPRRKRAWLAIPAVAAALWVAFALGSLLGGDPPGGPAVTPTTPVVQPGTTGGTMSPAPTTSSDAPTTTETTTSTTTAPTDPTTSHPGKGKGKKK